MDKCQHDSFGSPCGRPAPYTDSEGMKLCKFHARLRQKQKFTITPPLDPLTNGFDYAEAARRRNEAMEQVEKNANPDWSATAYEVGHSIALRQPILTADDVEEELEKHPVSTHEKRAMGPVMRKLQLDGVIEDTGKTGRSRMVQCHQMPRRIWRSLVYGQKGQVG